MARTDYLHFRQNSIKSFYYNIAIYLVIELTSTNIIAKYDQNLKSTKNTWVINIDQNL